MSTARSDSTRIQAAVASLGSSRMQSRSPAVRRFSIAPGYSTKATLRRESRVALTCGPLSPVYQFLEPSPLSAHCYIPFVLGEEAGYFQELRDIAQGQALEIEVWSTSNRVMSFAQTAINLLLPICWRRFSLWKGPT